MVDKREILVVHIEKKRSKALCVMTKQDALLFVWEWIGSTAIDLCYPMKPWSFSSFSRSVPSAFFKACLCAIFFAKPSGRSAMGFSFRICTAELCRGGCHTCCPRPPALQCDTVSVQSQQSSSRALVSASSNVGWGRIAFSICFALSPFAIATEISEIMSVACSHMN